MKKNIVFLLILIPIIWISCDGMGHQTIDFRKIENLMPQHPDSALMLLEQIENKKNKTGNKQISDNRDLKSNRGRKKEKPIQGIVLKHYECLKLLITLYQDGAMGIKKETSQVALARYIDDKKLLGNIRNGIFIPLKFSTILKETNTIWNEMLRDKSIGIK